MAVTNSIFNTPTKPDSIYRLKQASLDSNVMTVDEEKSFNTYRHWTPFLPPMEAIVEATKNSEGKPNTSAVSGKHVRSLFNAYNGVPVYDALRVDMNMPLLDNPDSRKRQRELSACTIKDLVDDSAAGKMGRQIYNYSDFAYCKHLGKISNNYLITLRRFAAPCGDKIDRRRFMQTMEDGTDKHYPDLGRLVTWMGTPGNEMSNILKYTFGVNWETKEAEITDESTSGEGKGPLASVFNLASSNYRTRVMQGRAGGNFPGKSVMNKMLGNGENFDPPYPSSKFDGMYDKTKVWGPIDVIDKITRRKKGLNFEHKFTLTFDYELRSYYGVNGRSAMLDLLGNILAVTYTHGIFWGGAHRFIGGSQDNIFANLPIFKLADKGGLNNPGAVYDALMESIDQGAKAFTSGVKGETTKEKIKNLAKDLGGMLLGGLLNKLGRPEKMTVSSLLNNAPTGCWHVTIGNPKNPIIEIGNLICEGAEVEHYGPLGLDDFPTGIRVKVTLAHGRPRDLGEIEKMYNRGDTRIYTPMGEEVLKMYENASNVNYNIVSNQSSPSLEESSGILSNLVNKVKQGTPLESMSSLIITDTATPILQVNPSTPGDITKLMKHFGTEEGGLISTSGAESFTGAEKHKNDTVK